MYVNMHIKTYAYKRNITDKCMLKSQRYAANKVKIQQEISYDISGNAKLDSQFRK